MYKYDAKMEAIEQNSVQKETFFWNTQKIY